MVEMFSNAKSKHPNVSCRLKPEYARSRLFFTLESKLKPRFSYLDNNTPPIQSGVFLDKTRNITLSAAQ